MVPGSDKKGKYAIPFGSYDNVNIGSRINFIQPLWCAMSFRKYVISFQTLIICHPPPALFSSYHQLHSDLHDVLLLQALLNKYSHALLNLSHDLLWHYPLPFKDPLMHPSMALGCCGI